MNAGRIPGLMLGIAEGIGPTVPSFLVSFALAAVVAALSRRSEAGAPAT